MEFIISQSGYNLRLPVPPDKYEVTTGNLNTVVTVEELGELLLMGKSKLASLSMETFWPSKQYSFCQYKNFILPYEAMNLIKKWKDSGKPVQVIITSTPINMAMSIDDFTYGERDGTRDVYFQISFKEYRYVKLSTKTITVAAAPKKKYYPPAPTRPTTKVTPKTYKVVRGDSLSKISKKVYGSSSKWRTLYSKNRKIIKNPNLIYPGQVLTL